MPSTRRQDWKNGWARRRTNSRLDAEPEVGGTSDQRRSHARGSGCQGAQGTAGKGIASGRWQQRIDGTLTRRAGTSSAARQRRVRSTSLSPHPRVHRQKAPSEPSHNVFGWKAFVRCASRAAFVDDALFCSRHEYRFERLFDRLKSRVRIAPLFSSSTADRGLTYL